MNCVGDQIRRAVRMYCDGDTADAEEELSQLFDGSIELARGALRKLHVFFEDERTSLVPLEETGLFFQVQGHDVSVRLQFPTGNKLTVTLTIGGW